MRENRIRLDTAFHATCYKLLSSMLHATRMNMFIFVACSMLNVQYSIRLAISYFKVARRVPNDA